MSRRLSMTIVSHNDYEDIKRTITSMDEHTDKKLDKCIYIVDNSCKKPESSEKRSFLQFLSAHDDVEYLDTGANLGFGRGHNLVLDRLDSEYHAIVNPDIKMEEDAFSPILAYMDANPDVGMCIPKIYDEHHNLQRAYRREPTVFDMFIRMFCRRLFPRRIDDHTLQDMDYTSPFQVPFAQGCFLIIRTELFRRLEGFDGKFFLYLEDADLCRRVNAVSKVMYCPEAAVTHKWNRGSHHSFRLFCHHVSSMLYYFRKWGMKWR